MPDESDDMEDSEAGYEVRRWRTIVIVGTAGCEAADRWRLCRCCLGGGGCVMCCCLDWSAVWFALVLGGMEAKWRGLGGSTRAPPLE
jgi:hypothetical protein